MNAESNTPPTGDVSSHLGRQWLQSTNQDLASNAELEHEMVVVSIPDVSQGPDFPPEANQESLNRINLLVGTLTEHTPPKAQPDNLETREHSSNFIGDRDDASGDRKFESPAKQNHSFDQIKSDLAEPTEDWVDQPGIKDPQRVDDDDLPQAVARQPDVLGDFARTDHGNTAIATLTDAIIERFPLGAPAVLTFVGSEANRHIDETCARVATELAQRKLGRILLLDADDLDKSLSKASGVEGELGFTNVVNNGHDWEKAVYGRSATGLDFMAVGTGRFHASDPGPQLRKTVVELKREYQFICVAAGDAHGHSARLWNDVSDGSYLLVSVKNTHEAIAKSAVTEMRSSGARLLGCVVTDVG